ncbi:MAG: hypothetical protein HYS32_02570 [Candidatus Woesearchaeota archaeon]|nr:MAG: hypothetical protein HYS32_02570 [Candidatus Woesearchaeota archaeon]
MKKGALLNSILSVVILSIVVLGVVAFFVYQKRWMGFIFIALGFLHLFTLKIFGVNLKSTWPDIVFGIIDNGILVIAAIIGADFAGITGAIIGGSAANAITDGFAGIFEGWTAEYLRKHKIKEKRTALSSAVGKMAGCFFGAGIVLVIVWTILSL